MSDATEAARAFDLQMAKRRGEDWIDRLAAYYQHPWISGEAEHRLARALLDLRAAGVDVYTAYAMSEREMREIEADVPVRKGAEELL